MYTIATVASKCSTYVRGQRRSLPIPGDIVKTYTVLVKGRYKNKNIKKNLFPHNAKKLALHRGRELRRTFINHRSYVGHYFNGSKTGVPHSTVAPISAVAPLDLTQDRYLAYIRNCVWPTVFVLSGAGKQPEVMLTSSINAQCID